MVLRTCELLGLAGAGKSSLIKRVQELDPSVDWRVETDRSLGMSAVARFLWRRPRLCLESLRRMGSRGRWAAWREMSWVDEWVDTVDERREQENGVILFERGPLHKLARLDAFAPGRETEGLLEAWWHTQARWWLTNLDLVVWLDAPVEILAQRVRQRDEGRRDRYETHGRAAEYDRGFARIWTAGEGTGVHLMRVDAAREPIAEVASRVLAALHKQSSSRYG